MKTLRIGKYSMLLLIIGMALISIGAAANANGAPYVIAHGKGNANGAPYVIGHGEGNATASYVIAHGEGNANGAPYVRVC